jgi:WS/DGAT/MGAT family acyltransferase
MHHSIADGIALARVMLGLTDGDESSADAAFAAPAHGRAQLPLEGTVRELAHVAGAVAHETTETVLHPGHALDIGREAAQDAVALAQLLAAPSENPNALRGDLGPTQRAAWSRVYPLAAIKAAAKSRGATINDLLVACVAGAARRHLEASGEEPVNVHAMVPFNLRPLDRPLPRDLGNRFGLVLLELPVADEDAEARVQQASERMSAIKRSRQGEVSYAILGAIGHTPPEVEAQIVKLFSAKATTVLTNVPGPRSPVSLAGSPVRGVLVWAPCSGSMGMSVSIFSYDGGVTTGFMVNGRVLDEPQRLVAAYEAELDALLA